ncbi:MAG: phage major capsid protein [Bacteroidales bacterium]|nr:phage major capsid protein [Candidatus Scybalousia scybalohippi]
MEKFMEELMSMDMDQVMARRAEMETEIRSAESKEALEGMEEKMNAINTRIAELKDLEERKAAAVAINEGTVETNVKEKREMPAETKKEIDFRSSVDYGKAFLRGIKTGDFKEARKIMTELAPESSVGLNDTATIPVPTMLDTEIRNAWETHNIINLVKKTYQKGIVKAIFEVSATGASIHLEGADAPEQEKLVLGSVELTPANIKKWITISDEALEGTTVDTIGYIYKEIAQKIAEKAEEEIIKNITTAQVATDATHPGVAELKANPSNITIIDAVALLSGKATNVSLAMNRQTYSAFAKIALEAGYAIDVFDGLKDKIQFTDELKPFNEASVDDVYMIVGDFGYGYQANFPNGNDVTIKRDDLSLAEYDLVKIVGKQYVGHGVVAPKAFVNVKKVAIA